MCRTLQVTLRRTLTSLDYKILTEALSGQQIMLWVCLCSTQVPRGDIFFCFYLSFWFSSAFACPWFVFSIRMRAETWTRFPSHRERKFVTGYLIFVYWQVDKWVFISIDIFSLVFCIKFIITVVLLHLHDKTLVFVIILPLSYIPYVRVPSPVPGEPPFCKVQFQPWSNTN